MEIDQYWKVTPFDCALCVIILLTEKQKKEFMSKLHGKFFGRATQTEPISIVAAVTSAPMIAGLKDV